MWSQQDVVLLWQVMPLAFGCPEEDGGGTGSVTGARAALRVAL